MCRCTEVQECRGGAEVQVQIMCRFAGLQMCRCADVQMCRCADEPDEPDVQMEVQSEALVQRC